MPSPVAHASLVLFVRAAIDRQPGLHRAVTARPALLYSAAIATMWAPDIDFVLRALVDHPAFRHGGATHSLVAGVLLGLLFAVACRLRYGAVLPLLPAFGIGVGCAWGHGLMDMATYGSGVMLMWPFSLERFRTPVPLFFGARHSRPTEWHLHLITLVTELLFVAIVWWVAHRWWRRPQARAAADPPA